jgi:hypothetical protein
MPGQEEIVEFQSYGKRFLKTYFGYFSTLLLIGFTVRK